MEALRWSASVGLVKAGSRWEAVLMVKHVPAPPMFLQLHRPLL